MELSWHNPPWCLQSKCDKGRLSKGTEDDLAVVLWDKKETLSSQTDWVERNKPTHCSLNRLQGQWGALFLCVICADAVVQISVVLSLHCAELCKCLGADLRHSNQSCTWETLLSSPPTILKCWLNFKFFCRKKKRRNPENAKFKYHPVFSDFLLCKKDLSGKLTWWVNNTSFLCSLPLPLNVDLEDGTQSVGAVYWPPALHVPSQMKITDIIYCRLTLPGAVQYPWTSTVWKLTHNHIHYQIMFLCFCIS